MARERAGRIGWSEVAEEDDDNEEVEAEGGETDATSRGATEAAAAVGCSGPRARAGAAAGAWPELGAGLGLDRPDRGSAGAAGVDECAEDGALSSSGAATVPASMLLPRVAVRA